MPTSVRRDGALVARALRWRHANRWIVDGIDLIVRPGEIVGLLGPNGAGKTVTLSMMVGMLRPTSGHVFIDGVEITHLPLHKRARLGLAYLPQNRSVFTKLSAEDNIAAILEARGMPKREMRARTVSLLESFGLSHVAKTKAARLSGGEQRRLEVARSLAIEPHFLLFDEPFAGIDPLTIESLRSILLRLRATGAGILITDHNVRATLTLCDRAVVLFNGRVLAEGTPAELVANDAVRRHFLGDVLAVEDVGGEST
ncbi:MAG: LPS export ABC transporter ATP-binding protein [Gemmatimonadales bacterium]